MSARWGSTARVRAGRSVYRGAPLADCPAVPTHGVRLEHSRRGSPICSDAAHVVHPLAGQGLNLGLADARALTDAIAHAVSVGADGALRRFVLRAVGCVLRVACGRSRAAQALAYVVCRKLQLAVCVLRVAVGAESTLRAYEDSRKTTNAVMARESRSPSNRPKGYSAR